MALIIGSSTTPRPLNSISPSPKLNFKFSAFNLLTVPLIFPWKVTDLFSPLIKSVKYSTSFELTLVSSKFVSIYTSSIKLDHDFQFLYSKLTSPFKSESLVSISKYFKRKFWLSIINCPDIPNNSKPDFSLKENCSVFILMKPSLKIKSSASMFKLEKSKWLKSIFSLFFDRFSFLILNLKSSSAISSIYTWGFLFFLIESFEESLFINILKLDWCSFG